MRTGLPEYNISLESITHVSVLSDRIPLWHNGKIEGAVAIFRNRTEVTKLAQDLTGVQHIVEALRAYTHEFTNKQNLMNELNKIRRVIDREGESSSKEVLLVLDATTGQNGLIQAKQFSQSAGITGIVLTKLDGTAKGGVVLAIAKEMGVPVKYVGLGEGIDDLQPFDPAAFAEALV